MLPGGARGISDARIQHVAEPRQGSTVEHPRHRHGGRKGLRHTGLGHPDGPREDRGLCLPSCAKRQSASGVLPPRGASAQTAGLHRTDLGTHPVLDDPEWPGARPEARSGRGAHVCGCGSPERALGRSHDTHTPAPSRARSCGSRKVRSRGISLGVRPAGRQSRDRELSDKRERVCTTPVTLPVVLCRGGVRRVLAGTSEPVSVRAGGLSAIRRKGSATWPELRRLSTLQ